MTKSDLPDELRVRAWMSPPEHTIDPDSFVDDAFRVMRRADVRHLLVTKGEELAGVVTDRDLRRPDWSDGEVLSARDMYRFGDELRVYDVMTSEVITVQLDDATAFAARLMVENKINCLPVLQGDKVVGIITSSDLLGALVREVDPELMEMREAMA